MTVRVRPVPVEERLKKWNFPLYPVNRRVEVKHKHVGIPVIEGRKLRVEGREECFVCRKPRSTNAVNNTLILSNPNFLLYPHQRFNESRPQSRKDSRPRRLTVDGRQTPLAMECWQTNLMNHSLNQMQSTPTPITPVTYGGGNNSNQNGANHVIQFGTFISRVGTTSNQSQSSGSKRTGAHHDHQGTGHGRPPPARPSTPSNHSNHTTPTTPHATVVTRTVIEDKGYNLNRTNSLPILLEKKSVEIKPRYEPKKPLKKRIQPPVEASEPEKAVPVPESEAAVVENDGKIPYYPEKSSIPQAMRDKLIDHNISVTITDKRTRSVVRASSASSLRTKAASLYI